MNRYATRFMTLLVAMLITAGSSVMASGPVAWEVGYDVSMGTYSRITGGTVHATGSNIVDFGDMVSLPFSVDFNGSTYSEAMVYGSGSVGFGGQNGGSDIVDSKKGANVQGSSPGGSDGMVNAWKSALDGLPTGEIRSETIGTAPNRVFVIQWSNVTRAPAGSSNDNLNFQIRMNENDGSINVVYGSMTVAGPMGARIGLESTSNGSLDLVTRYHMTTWQYPQSTGDGDESIALPGFVPMSGLTYSFNAAKDDDASVVALSSPDAPFMSTQAQTMRVVVRNWGVNELDSVKINWSINGVAQTPVMFYPQPALQTNEEVVVQIGTRSFAPMSFNTFMAWTSQPNGVADENPGNDRFMTYVAPMVEGRLNIAQGGTNNGVFKSFRDCIRHLQVSGISNNVNVWVFGGAYNEKIWMPEIDGNGMVTFLEAPNNEVIVTWQPANRPQTSYGRYEENTHQVFLDSQADVVFRGFEFRIPNGLNWGGNVHSAFHANATIEDCLITGPNNYLTVSNPHWAVDLVGLNSTVRNSMLTKNKLGIQVNSTTQGSANVYGNELEDAAQTGISINSNNMMVDANTIKASNGITSFTGMDLSGTGTITKNWIAADLTAQPNSTATGIRATSRYYQGRMMSFHNNIAAIGANSSTTGISVNTGAVPEIENKGGDNVQGGNPFVTYLYHNSVNITGAAGASSNGATLVGANDFVVVNNIFHNAGNSTNGGYAVIIGSANSDPIATSDFNNLMTTGTNVALYMGNTVARNATGNPLANLQAATMRDYNSSSVAVAFVGGSDLHLLEINQRLFGSSSITGLVSEDIDGENRVIPYMGADEIRPSVRIIEQPLSRYACLGETFELICVADVTVGADVTYQWYKDGNELTGQTGAILVFGSIGYGAAGVYTCEVQATDGFTEVRLMSDAASIIVVRNTQIIVHPKSQPIAPGATIVLEVEAEAIGAPTDFQAQYQWRKRFWDPQSVSYQFSDVVDNGRITGAQSNRLTIREAQDSDTTDTYVCVVTGYCGTAFSKAANLFFPSVAAQNNTPAACEGGNLQMEVSVIPSVIPGSTLGYQWYFQGMPISNGSGVSGANSKVLTIENATAAVAGDYYCEATYSGVDAIASNTVTATVGVAPTITGQPVGDTICAGETAMMVVAASGPNVTVHWFKGTTEIPGATNDTLMIADATADASGDYTARVMNACGTLSSEIVTLLVNTAVSITTEPTDIAVNDGDTVRMSVAVSGSEPVTYQWFRNNDSIVGATSAEYKVVAGIEGNESGTYYCIVTNECGADTSTTANADVTVGVNDEPIAAGYSLGLPSPNPTQGNVTFNFTVPSTQFVEIKLTNIVGSTVATLVSETVNAGTHPVMVNGAELNLAPGVYTYTFVANGVLAARQFVVVK